MVNYPYLGVRGSVVERVPDKNEVHGSIPCAPTYLTGCPLFDKVRPCHHLTP